MAEVTGVDAERRELMLDRGETARLRQPDRRLRRARPPTSATTSGSEPSCGLKTLADAVALRDRIFGAFEEAERATGRRPSASVADVRGRSAAGPTGVEVAGQLAVARRHHMTASSRASTRATARVDPARRRRARARRPSARSCRPRPRTSSTSLGVDVREGARATAIDADGVDRRGRTARPSASTARDGDLGGRRAARRRSPASLAEATGAEHDRGGRIKVEPGLTLPGHPEISVIGDAATHRRARRQAAARAGDGRDPAGAARRRAGSPPAAPGATAPFRYFDKGALAVVGRGRAVCEVRGLRVVGPARVRHLPRRASLLPRRRARPARDRC